MVDDVIFFKTVDLTIEFNAEVRSPRCDYRLSSLWTC